MTITRKGKEALVILQEAMKQRITVYKQTTAPRIRTKVFPVTRRSIDH